MSPAVLWHCLSRGPQDPKDLCPVEPLPFTMLTKAHRVPRLDWITESEVRPAAFSAPEPAPDSRVYLKAGSTAGPGLRWDRSAPRTSRTASMSGNSDLSRRPWCHFVVGGRSEAPSLEPLLGAAGSVIIGLPSIAFCREGPYSWSRAALGRGIRNLRSRPVACGEDSELGSRCDSTCLRAERSQSIRGDSLKGIGESTQIERLRDDDITARRARGFLLRREGMGGDGHDERPCSNRVGSQSARRFPAVHTGHGQVHQDDVGLNATSHFKRFCAASRLCYWKSTKGQILHEHFASVQ